MKYMFTFAEVNARKMASNTSKENDNKDKYIAAMVLAGVGDALGYRSGNWEFNFVGKDIHKEVDALGGLKNLSCKRKF